ncbi:MAG: hypothetical protein RL609_721, partial [Bacteroidota bacterium]
MQLGTPMTIINGGIKPMSMVMG